MQQSQDSDRTQTREIRAIGFDPGRDKCGVARVVLSGERSGERSIAVEERQVVPSATAIEFVTRQCETHDVTLLVIGDGTSSKQWQDRLKTVLPDSVLLVKVDEYNSTQEARDRYWQLYPPRGLMHLVPTKLRSIPRPIDDIVAVILVERWAAAEKGITDILGSSTASARRAALD